MERMELSRQDTPLETAERPAQPEAVEQPEAEQPEISEQQEMDAFAAQNELNGTSEQANEQAEMDEGAKVGYGNRNVFSDSYLRGSMETFSQKLSRLEREMVSAKEKGHTLRYSQLREQYRKIKHDTMESERKHRDAVTAVKADIRSMR